MDDKCQVCGVDKKSIHLIQADRDNLRKLSREMLAKFIFPVLQAVGAEDERDVMSHVNYYVQFEYDTMMGRARQLVKRITEVPYSPN